METINLIGAETVQGAGIAMRYAADEMHRAASTFADALMQHHHWMDDWLLRLTQALEEDRIARLP